MGTSTISRGLAVLSAAGACLIIGGPAPASSPTTQTSQPAWTALVPGDLLWFTESLTGSDDATRALRAQVAEHLTAKYLTAPTSARKVSISQWERFAKCLAPDIPEDRKLLWAQKLREAFLDRSPGGGESTALSRTASTLGVINAVVQSVVEAQTPPAPDDLLWLTRAVAGTADPGRLSRLRIVACLNSRFFPDVTAVRSVTTAQWQDFAKLLGKDLPADIRAAWLGKLREAFAANAQAIGTMNIATLREFARTLQSFGDPNPSGLAASFMAVNASWQEWKPADLLELASVLDLPPTPAKEAKVRLAAHVEGKYLADVSTIRAYPCQLWADLVARLAKDMPYAARTVWAGKLRSAFASTVQTVAGLQDREIMPVVNALNELQDAQLGTIVAAWMGTTSAWQAWSPRDICWLARWLGEYPERTESASRRLAEFADSQYFKDVQTTRSVSCGSWADLTKYLGRQLSAQTREMWAAVLWEAFARSATDVQALSPRDVQSLAKAMWALDERKAADLALAWAQNRAAWAQTSPGDLVQIISFAVGSDKADRKALMADLDAALLSTGLNALNWQQLASISRGWLLMGNLPKGREWAMRVHDRLLGTEEARREVDLEHLADLSAILAMVGLVGDKGPPQGREYLTYAAALVDLARRDALQTANLDYRERYYRYCARMVSTGQARQIVESELVGADGRVRLGLAKVLSWAYYGEQRMPDWRGFLEAKAAAAEGGPDEKALWLTARAHAATLTLKGVNLALSIDWLGQALAVADSPDVRWRVVAELLDYHRMLGRPATAAVLLESVQGQFSGSVLEKAQDVHSQLLAEMAAQEVRLARQKALSEAAQKSARLEHYRHRLRAARACGDERAAASLQAAIQRLENEIGR